MMYSNLHERAQLRLERGLLLILSVNKALKNDKIDQALN